MVNQRKRAVGSSVAGHRRKRRRRLTVILVDGREWTREALAKAIEISSRDVRMLCFGHASELRQAEIEGPLVVLLNVTGLQLSDDRIWADVAAARSSIPSVPIALLSDRESAERILAAVARGVDGCIPISLGLRPVIETLRFIAAGGTFVPVEPLLQDAEAASSTPIFSADPTRRAVIPQIAVSELTPRELAVLALLGRGQSNKRIALDLDLSEATVKVHVRHIMRKVGATNRTQVALLAESFARQP